MHNRTYYIDNLKYIPDLLNSETLADTLGVVSKMQHAISSQDKIQQAQIKLMQESLGSLEDSERTLCLKKLSRAQTYFSQRLGWNNAEGGSFVDVSLEEAHEDQVED